MLPSSGRRSHRGTHGGQGVPQTAALPSAWLDGSRQHLPMQPKPMAEGLKEKWHQHLGAEQLLGLGQGPRQRVPTCGSGVRPQDGDFHPLAPAHTGSCRCWGGGVPDTEARTSTKRSRQRPPQTCLCSRNPLVGATDVHYDPPRHSTERSQTAHLAARPLRLIYPGQMELSTCGPSAQTQASAWTRPLRAQHCPGCFSGPQGLVGLHYQVLIY